MTEEIKPEHDVPDERRLALRRLLRRRKRRYKEGANSGAPVKSWAEYSSTSFTPSGDRSFLQIAGWGLALFVTILLPIWAFAKSDNHERRWEDMPVWIWGVYILVGLVMIVSALAVALVITTSMWRVLQSIFSKEEKE